MTCVRASGYATRRLSRVTGSADQPGRERCVRSLVQRLVSGAHCLCVIASLAAHTVRLSCVDCSSCACTRVLAAHHSCGLRCVRVRRWRCGRVVICCHLWCMWSNGVYGSAKHVLRSAPTLALHAKCDADALWRPWRWQTWEHDGGCRLSWRRGRNGHGDDPRKVISGLVKQAKKIR